MSENTLRRILNQFGSDSSIEGIEYDIRTGDAILLLFAGLAGLLIATSGTGPLIGPALAVAGVGLFLAAVALVYVRPPGEKSALSWLGGILAFWRSDKELSSVDANPQNRTDTLTQVSRFHPNARAVERTDGDLVGAVKVTPANLSLASDGDWNAAADALGDALSTLDFSVLIYSSGRNVDSEQVVNAYDGRQFDEDIRDNPVLCDLVEMYQDYFPQEFSSIARNLSVREYHVFVPVSESEVQLEGLGAFATLASLPLVGTILDIGSTVRAGFGAASVVDDQQKALATRVQDVEGALRGVDGLSTEVMASEQIAGAIQEFWTGEKSQFNDQRQLRSIPVVVSETNEEFES